MAEPVPADPNLQAALAHWTPRMVANGVDYNDILATIARVRVWRDWCSEWMRTAARHEEIATAAEARDAPLSAAEAWTRAALCHHFGKFVCFEDMAAYRRAHQGTVADYARAAALNGAERVAIPYRGSTLAGYLRRPPGVARAPVAWIICGLDSVKEEFAFFETLFHARGLATLCLDGPGQGEGESLPIEPAYETVAGAVCDWLAGRADVDGVRLGAVGISLGGYYAARVAALEPRLRAGASVGGPYDFGAVFDTAPLLTRQALQVRFHAPDLAQARERSRALTLDGIAGRIDRPFCIVFGAQDRLIPAAQAERLFAEIGGPDKRLEMFADGNHVCNNIPYAWRPLLADWLAGHLAA
jgi:dienelactone hydrolase